MITSTAKINITVKAVANNMNIIAKEKSWVVEGEKLGV